MTFRETLDKHLRAIHDRDLAALNETLPADELLLVMSDGRVVRSVREYVEAYRSWFAAPTWRLAVDPIRVTETAEMGVAVLGLDYRESPPGRDPVRQTSVLTLVFQRVDGRWVMVLDQITPVRSSAG